MAWYFYLAFGFSILAYCEGLIITLICREPQSNVRGLYWVVQRLRREASVTVGEPSHQTKEGEAGADDHQRMRSGSDA